VKILRWAGDKYSLTVSATGVSANNRLIGLFLKVVKETERLTNTEMAVIPCIQIPLTINSKLVDAYRRWLTYYEIERQIAGEMILNKYLEDPVFQCRRDWKIILRDIASLQTLFRDGI
jgi:hypothetical protein